MKPKILQMMFAALVCASAQAQINTGSNGSDGALDFSSINYTTNIVINMADHPNGIYQYTSVNIPTNVTVTFIPNANNSPITWLVQNNVTINGTVDASGQVGQHSLGGQGGPGGWHGGSGGSTPGNGQGPGGGTGGLDGGMAGAFAGAYSYCNSFLIPLLGGSGGGGLNNNGQIGYGGGGGGGAIVIAASSEIILNGSINANGAGGVFTWQWSGSGSGGAIRLVAARISGGGALLVGAGYPPLGDSRGRVRLDTYENDFSGGISGGFTQGSQFVIVPSAGQLPQLTVTSVGGVAVSASPTGALSTPDAVLSAQQNNPVPVVVSCANLPLNTQITVSVKPANSAAVSATGYNTTGTLASSTATVSIVIPRGGGLIYATAATGN